jgi:hypothetical protein
MTSVDPVYAQWLMGEGLWQVSDDATRRARWGADGLTTQRLTTIATKTAAAAEAARQLDFLGGPLAIEEHMLLGEWAWALGSVITVTFDQIGYDAGLDVFVIGVEDNLSAGTSTVTVIRRL